MNHVLRFVCAVTALCFSTGPATAQVMLPDGQIVPRNPGNGEKQMDALFSERGEAIHWINDASAKPDTFSPLCGFSATLVLKESGSSLAVGWYNVVPGAGSAPTSAQIFEILAAGSGVGSTVAGATIRAHPSYGGGSVGFALVRNPPHFTESQWNTYCSGGDCAATPGNWILSLSYRSVLEDNAYYVAFEDGNTSSTGWNNDGDYNDYVFLFTGLACEGAGEPCLVPGAEGVCATGLTECDSLGVLGCTSLVAPEDEICDGVDNDCQGGVDDGEGLCPEQEVCASGNCVPHCGEEFPCLYGDVCDDDLCVHPDCAGLTCPDGEACRQGTCEAPCDGIVCPGGQVCRVGRCIDPCLGITCGNDRVCDGGVCVLPCSCQPCGGGRACHSSGRCVDQGCEQISCSDGDFCRAGSCVDACDGAVCPAAGECVDGSCQPGSGTTSVDDDGGIGDGGDGDGAGELPAADAATGFIGTSGGRPPPDNSGCGCTIIGNPGLRSSAALWLLLGLIWLRSRRRGRH